MRNSRTVALALMLALSHTGCGVKVNQSIRVEDGSTMDGDRITVNGSIRIGSKCEVRGDCRTVNGRITGNSIVEGDVVVRGRKGVVVYLADGGEVRGEVRGAKIVRE